MFNQQSTLLSSYYGIIFSLREKSDAPRQPNPPCVCMWRVCVTYEQNQQGEEQPVSKDQVKAYMTCLQAQAQMPTNQLVEQTSFKGILFYFRM